MIAQCPFVLLVSSTKCCGRNKQIAWYRGSRWKRRVNPFTVSLATTLAEAVELYRTMIAYSGAYSLEGNNDSGG